MKNIARDEKIYLQFKFYTLLIYSLFLPENNKHTIKNIIFIYRCISINYSVVEKFIYFRNSTQIVKLVY